jgi:hypothetical protein
MGRTEVEIVAVFWYEEKQKKKLEQRLVKEVFFKEADIDDLDSRARHAGSNSLRRQQDSID